MISFPVRLVLIQYDGMFSVAAGPVHPHIALGLRRLPIFAQDLQSSLISMEHLML